MLLKMVCYFLAIFTGINSAKVFGATPGLGGVIGGTTLLTGITDENPIKNIFTGEHLAAGQGGIIGVIFAVWLHGWLRNDYIK